MSFDLSSPVADTAADDLAVPCSSDSAIDSRIALNREVSDFVKLTHDVSHVDTATSLLMRMVEVDAAGQRQLSKSCGHFEVVTLVNVLANFGHRDHFALIADIGAINHTLLPRSTLETALSRNVPSDVLERNNGALTSLRLQALLKFRGQVDGANPTSIQFGQALGNLFLTGGRLVEDVPVKGSASGPAL